MCSCILKIFGFWENKGFIVLKQKWTLKCNLNQLLFQSFFNYSMVEDSKGQVILLSDRCLTFKTLAFAATREKLNQ